MKPPETREPVTIRTCRDLAEAQVVRSMLEAGGVHAFIPDENAAGLYPATVLDTDGVRVQVAAEDAELALTLIEHEET
jgi:hypothetical protein